MQDVLIHLLGAFPVQRAQDIVAPVGIGGHKAVVTHLVVDVLLIGLDPAVFIAHQGVGHRVLIDPAVGGHPALVAGAPHQGDPPLAKGGIDSGQHAGVVSGAEVNAHRIPAGGAHRLHVPLQTLYVLHRHDRDLFQHIGGGGDPVGEGDDANTALHHLGLVAHPDTPDAGHPGKPLFQRRHMRLKLIVIG